MWNIENFINVKLSQRSFSISDLFSVIQNQNILTTICIPNITLVVLKMICFQSNPSTLWHLFYLIIFPALSTIYNKASLPLKFIKYNIIVNILNPPDNHKQSQLFKITFLCLLVYFQNTQKSNLI